MADWGYEAGHFEPDRGPVVLLVEDEMIVAFDIADQLTCAGYLIDGPYPSIARALSALAMARPDVAILDVQLIDGEVYPVADRLCAIGVPIVFHSCHAMPADLYASYPGSAVCMKPCRGGRLEQAVRTVLSAIA